MCGKDCCAYKDSTLLTAQILAFCAFIFGTMGNLMAALTACVAMVLLLSASCCLVQRAVFICAVIFSGGAIIGEILTIVLADDLVDDNCDSDEDGGLCEESTIVAMGVLGLIFSTITFFLTIFFLLVRYDMIQEEYRRNYGRDYDPSTIRVEAAQVVVEPAGGETEVAPAKV